MAEVLAEVREKVKEREWPTIVLRPPIYYPESDGKPMAETDAHYRQMTDLRFALEAHFHDAPDVYVGANMLLYYVEGDPHQVVAPDVFVVRGVPKGDRRIYKVWEEGKAPDVVFELTSASTRMADLGPKKGTYEVLGVQEYFLFDPLKEYLEPPLQGYRLEKRGYRWMEGTPLTSEVLGLELRVEEGWLRLYERESGQRLPTPAEVAEARRQAEARAEQEAEARRQAEARAEQEAEARRQAEARAEQEAEARRQAEARAQATEDELARLQAELARLRGPGEPGHGR